MWYNSRSHSEKKDTSERIKMVEAYKIRANALETSMGPLPATHVGLLYLVPKTIFQPLKKEHERLSE